MDIDQPSKNDKLSIYMCQHFLPDTHSFEDFSFQIIDVIDNSNLDEDQVIMELNSKEDFYMRTLNTIFPLGLNDRLQGGGRVSNESTSDALYFSSPVPRRKRSHGVRKSGRKKVQLTDSHNILKDQLNYLLDANKLVDFYKKLKGVKDNELRTLEVYSY